MDTHQQRPHEQSGLSRREFFRRTGAGVLVAAAALAPHASGALDNTALALPLTWRQSAFAALVDQPFTVSFGVAGTQTWTLSKIVNAHEHGQDRPPRVFNAPSGESYYLIFRGATDDIVGQGTYLFSHTALGRFSLFVVPGAHDAQAKHYVATINRLDV